MNRIEHLIDCLMEEAAEAIVEASKCQRFTLDQKYLESNHSNRERLQREVKDFIIVARILNEEGILDAYVPTEQEYERKREKLLEKFMLLSREYGALQETDTDLMVAAAKAGAGNERERLAAWFEAAGDADVARAIRSRQAGPPKGVACTHLGYDFKIHGRRCPLCGTFMVDFGD